MKNIFFVEYNNCMKKWAVVLLIIFSFAILLAGSKTIIAITHPIKYKNEIIKYSNEYNLSPDLVASVINTESHFKKNAQSNKNALGLMQIKLSTVEFLIKYYNLNETIEKTNLFNPDTNIKFGCMYLNYLNKKFKNISTSLCAYNAGETVVRSWLNDSKYSEDKLTLKDIPFKETKNYILKIESNLKFYKKVF